MLCWLYFEKLQGKEQWEDNRSDGQTSLTGISLNKINHRNERQGKLEINSIYLFCIELAHDDDNQIVTNIILLFKSNNYAINNGTATNSIKTAANSWMKLMSLVCFTPWHNKTRSYQQKPYASIFRRYKQNMTIIRNTHKQLIICIMGGKKETDWQRKLIRFTEYWYEV